MKLLLLAVLAALCSRTFASSEFRNAWTASGTFSSSEALSVAYSARLDGIIVAGRAVEPSNATQAFCALHNSLTGTQMWTTRISNTYSANVSPSRHGDVIYVGGATASGDDRSFAVKLNGTDGSIVWRYDSSGKRTAHAVGVSPDDSLVYLAGEEKGAPYVETLNSGDGKQVSHGVLSGGLTGEIVGIFVTSDGVVVVAGNRFVSRLKKGSLSTTEWTQSLGSDYTIKDVTSRKGIVYVTGTKRAANQDFAFWKSFSLASGSIQDDYSGLVGMARSVLIASGVDGSDGPFVVGEESGSGFFVHKYELQRGSVVRRDFKGSLSGGYGSLIEENGRAVAIALAGSQTSKGGSKNYVVFKKELVDNCTGLPCGKMGTCVDIIDNFWCKCAAGFSGKYCSQDVNECDSNPCQHGAKCVNSVGMFSCLCPPGYTGATCEIDIDECDPSPCVHGSCNDLVADYHCVCGQGWEGKNCDANIDDCKTADCGHGVCSDKINGYSCQCLPGFQGTHCDVNIDECALSPCINGGTCVDGINGYQCVCPKGTSQPHCADTTDDCKTKTCYNGARCIDRIDSVECICSKGFTGKFCEALVDSCANQPCQNGGICSNLVDGVYCKCSAGYKGPRCEESRDYCESAPCQNGAQCINRPDEARFECACTESYYTGRRCEVVDTTAVSQAKINKENVESIASTVNQLTKKPLNTKTLTDITQTVKNLIHFGDLSDRAIDDTLGVVDSVVGAPTNVLSDSQSQSNTSAQLSHLLETFGENVLEKSGRNQLEISKKNMGLKSELFKGGISGDLLYTLTEERGLEMRRNAPGAESSPDWLASLRINQKLLPSSKPVVVNTVGLRNESLFQGDLPDKTKIVSPVLSLKLNISGAGMKDFPIHFSLRHSHRSSDANWTAANPRCVWWDYTALENRGNWSDKGCTSHTPAGAQYTNCTCFHTTNFAILVDIDSARGNDISDEHHVVLSVVSLIGCIASLVCVCLTIFVIVCFKMLRDNQAMQILLNLCIALFFGLLFFVVGNESYERVNFCRASSILVHYFILSAQMWMLMAAVNFYLNLVKVFGHKSSGLVWKYAIVAWGVPLLFVLPGVITEQVNDSNIYVRDSGACWLNGIGWFMGAFLAPILLIVVINWFVFGMVVKAIRNSQSGRDDKNALAYKLKIAIAVAQVLGLTWIFAGFTFLDGRIVFSYLFAIFASLQGFFIFLFNVVLNREIRSLLRTARKRGLRHVVGKSKNELEKDFAHLEVGSACDSISPTGDYNFGYVKKPRRSFWARVFCRRPRDELGMSSGGTGSSLSTSLPSLSKSSIGGNLSRSGSTSSRKSLIGRIDRRGSKTVMKEKQVIGQPAANDGDVILMTKTDAFSDLPYAKVNTAFYEGKFGQDGAI